MMKRNVWSWVGMIMAAWLAAAAAHAAVLNEARVVAATDALASMTPAAQTFTITAAGNYTLRITDLGEQGASADAFSSLSVVVHRGAQLVRVLSVPSSASTASVSVSLSAGTYQAQVLGITAGASQYGVELRNNSNALVWDDVGTVTAPQSSDYSTLQQPLTLTAGQSYTVTLSDRVFPVALSSLMASIAQGSTLSCATELLSVAATSASCTFTASASGNQLVVLAAKAGNSAGLYSVKVTHSSGAVVYSNSLPVGDMPAPVTVNLPATDSYTLTSLDLFTPNPLSDFKLALVQGAELLARPTAAGTAPGFNASSGAASLYVIATPTTGSAGLYSVQIRRGTTAVYSHVDSVVDSVSGGLEGNVFTAVLPSAGTYTLQLRDFVVPQTIAALSASVSQNGVVLGTLTAAGELQVTNAQAGEVTIAVLATAGSSGTGLYGVALAANGASPVLEVTQGVGAKVSSQVVSLQQARYGFTITDFIAPLSMETLYVAVTRGSQLVGQTIGGGSFAFDALLGNYTVSYITKARTSAGYGMYGGSLTTVPTVTLTNTATELSWTATDANTCTASGGWSGGRDTSGTASIGTLTATTTFTLTCTNAAGSTAQSVTINVPGAQASSGGGGGGAWSWCWLLGLALVASWRTLISARTTR